MKITKILFPFLAFALVVASSFSMLQPTTAHAYSNTRLMDDSVFDNVNSMSEAQIQTFLSSTVSSTCLANYSDIDFNWNGTSWSYGGSIPAAQIIYKAAQQWGLNPQVIIATLQKEESLVTGTSCDAWRYNSAMGYACPDSGGCNAKYAGFSRQVLWGSWQLKFNKERSIGNLGWDGDNSLVYSGFMTQGTFARCDGCTSAAYSGYATIDGQSIYLENGTTASLYSYTPHLGQSFPGIFEGWFGPAVINQPDPSVAQFVYRLYNPATNNHFFTLNIAERDNAVNHLGYRLEGPAFIGYGQDNGGMTPIYRLYSPYAKFHFYTDDLNEAIVAQQQLGYQMNGVAFYGYASAGAGRLPIYRVLFPATGKHLYTESLSEAQALAAQGWTIEGVAFYGQ